MKAEDGAVQAAVDGSWRPVYGKAHQRVLPPSANWYCSKICDWGWSDVLGQLVAFGAKNSVFIYQLAEERDANGAVDAFGSGVKVSFFAQLVRGKRDRRVTAVQFLSDSTGELRLVCGGEEGSVQIWDVASLTMIEQHRKHKAEVMAVTVSPTLDANFVVAGDRQGRISAWERDAGRVSVFLPFSGDGIHSMAISPHDKALVAVGYRSGVLCLVDAAQGSVRHRLAGHDQEVQCVAWKATGRSNHSAGEEEEDSIEPGLPDGEVWLASSSRDKTIKVWKITATTAEEPVLDQVLRLPTGKQGMSFTQTKQLWLPVAWSFNGTQKDIGKHCLWSGSFDGSLFRWEWNVAKTDAQVKKGKNRRAPCKPVVVKGGHNRMLFSIVMVPPRDTAPDEAEAVSMLTVSLDRELRLWKENVPSKTSAAATCVEKLTGLGGHAYSVSYNVATNLVAAGVGDQTIRLWSLGTDTASVTSDYQCDLLWKGLQSKVTCVQWHPVQQSLLAYGMEDGRMGVYDIQTKKYNHFCTTHDQEVQQLQWILLKSKKADDADNGENSFLESIKQLEAAQAEGQSLEEALIDQEGQTRKNRDGDGVKVLLWSCDAGGHLLESNADAVDQKSHEIMANSVAFEWDAQCELVAIGRANGVVEVMKWGERADDNSTAVRRFHEHLESVTCLAWGKGADAGLLASGGQDGKIFVYSCEKSTTAQANVSTGTNSTEVIQEGRLLGSLAGHSNKIIDLRWCSDVAQSLLASSSADGTVQVWNPTSLQREAYFNHHVGRVLSLDWVSPYTLVTGGEDQTLRLWDYTEQQKVASPQLKKHGKVKQPQEVETISTPPPAGHDPMQTQKGEMASTESLQESSSTDNCTAHTPTNNKPKKKKSKVVFHSETKLTSAEIASACCRVAGVKQEGSGADKMDGTNAKKPVGSLLAHTDRVSLRGFFVSEAKRFREEREWESLANTLLLQGNIAEALRIVAKEGALTPTWLSYAPMAGLDVWRETTNLYAHQLDSQGDKKAAAFHFLSIAKVRSAVACMVSGDAHKEALALIRSRLGPNDPLLDDTLGKYADFLAKRGRHGEAALALLNVGSVKAKTRAVHTLVNTGDMIYVRAALDVLLAEVECQEKIVGRHETDHEDGGEELSFPASFFISIAGHALAKAHFDVAETAGQLLQSRLVGASSSASHRLMWCLLSILKTLNEHQLAQCKLDEVNDEAMANRVDNLLQSDAPESVREFFEFLTRPCTDTKDAGDRLYDRVLDEYASANLQEGKQIKQWIVDRADHFWFQILSACRRCGYWFDTEEETRIQEGQDFLVEANCFSNIEKAAATSARDAADNTITSSLQMGQRLLRFVMDVMSTSFIGALEHLREVFLLLAQDDISTRIDDTNGIVSTSEGGSTQTTGAGYLDVMTLLYPCGFASLKELPQSGELAEEQLDTLVLWSSVLLSQCRLVLASLMSIAKNSSEQNLEFLIQSLLHRLRVWFLDDEATAPLSRGLMDTANQLQLQTLMNEVLVAVHGLATHREQNMECCANEQAEQDEATNECLSRKQALINDANDTRSRLTWSDDGVKE